MHHQHACRRGFGETDENGWDESPQWLQVNRGTGTGAGGGRQQGKGGGSVQSWPGVHRASVQVLKESGGPRRRGGECDGDALCRYAVFGPVRRASADRGTT